MHVFPIEWSVKYRWTYYWDILTCAVRTSRIFGMTVIGIAFVTSCPTFWLRDRVIGALVSPGFSLISMPFVETIWLVVFGFISNLGFGICFLISSYGNTTVRRREFINETYKSALALLDVRFHMPNTLVTPGKTAFTNWADVRFLFGVTPCMGPKVIFPCEPSRTILASWKHRYNYKGSRWRTNRAQIDEVFNNFENLQNGLVSVWIRSCRLHSSARANRL